MTTFLVLCFSQQKERTEGLLLLLGTIIITREARRPTSQTLERSGTTVAQDFLSFYCHLNTVEMNKSEISHPP
jgi:hypothetical protein